LIPATNREKILRELGTEALITARKARAARTLQIRPEETIHPTEERLPTPGNPHRTSGERGDGDEDLGGEDLCEDDW
jgi:hypothetical protein